MQYEIKPTLTKWFDKYLGEYSYDISKYGADSGFPYITYTLDCVKLYEKFEDDIYDMLLQASEDQGFSNIEAMVSTFNRSELLNSPEGRKTLLLWWSCETLANEKEMMLEVEAKHFNT